MTQTTPHLGLVKPGGGSTGLNTPADRVDIDVLNGNADAIDTWSTGVDTKLTAQLSRNQQWRGTTAAIGSVSGMVQGDTYQETDLLKRMWVYDGVAWQPLGLISGIITPSSIANSGGAVAQNADGSVTFTGVTSVSLNSVFSARFREYEVEYDLVRSAAGSGENIKLRAAGVDNAAAQYYLRKANSVGAGYAEVTNTALTSWDLGLPSAFVNVFKVLRVNGAFLAQNTNIFAGAGMETDNSSLVNLISLIGQHRVASSFDGLTLTAGGGTLTGRIHVTGLI